jgi:hypothetical protein
MTMAELRLARHIAEDVAEAIHALNHGDVALARACLEDLTRETREMCDAIQAHVFAALAPTP